MVQPIVDIKCTKCGAINAEEQKYSDGKILEICKSCQYTKTIGIYSTSTNNLDFYGIKFIMMSPENQESEVVHIY